MTAFTVFEMTGPDAEGWVAVAKNPPAKRAGIGETPEVALGNLLDYLHDKGS